MSNDVNSPGNRAQQGYQNLVFYCSLDISDTAYDKSTHGQCKTAPQESDYEPSCLAP